MKRVYTDDRFPGYEIINHGSGSFQLAKDGNVVAEFESWENPDGTVSEAFAQKRAQEYFERWSKMDLSGEVEQQMKAVDPETVPDHTEIFNAPPSKQAASLQIDKLMAQERMEADPEKKQKLRRMILQLMKQEESLAEAVVNHLIET
jgi:hypothetical protein